ncbi:Anthranilate synthase, amidotransferase component [Fulvivirga imtechensis AK7]|uniref:Anthranilate synthase, amidotransferase component n=1 Tax=Fulvivirga imtechensis AK7 TaxID=1237149 RepID=L8JPV8_9BACT|nr:aminodeoxychorismate/anthranilate synthase component II [Fulvivirga imtechensis]ELR70865.1 Anthranilate synthase, amidotransferase component [Fulvivirga imtechensis AK7]
MKNILLLDNYDSFTYNLVHIIRELGHADHLDVIRNDKILLEEVARYDKVLISPGPGIPDEAGILKALVKRYASTKSILGVCLGLQGIAEVFGCELYNMFTVLHGVASNITVQDPEDYIFTNIPPQFKACHYHSWAVLPESVNGALKVTALDEHNNIMGLSHVQYDVKGLQFHPESILTEHGKLMIENWLKN